MTSTHVLGVLDLTFLDIREEADFHNGLNLRLTALSSSSPTRPSTAVVSSDSLGSPSRKKGRKLFKAIRLSNNYLISADIIYNCIKDTFDVSRILWLDLSFNTITTIGEDFAKNFVNITTVQLHANKIYKLKEVRNICACPNLRAVSLYGNPIEEHKHYRNYVLYHCPKLTQFDMSPVTKSEMQRVSCFLCFGFGS